MQTQLMFTNLLKTSSLILGLFTALFFPVAFGAEFISIRHVVGILIISAMSVIFGRALGLLIKLPSIQGFRNGVEIVVGFSVLGALHLFMLSLFGLSILQVFAIDLVIFVAAFCLILKSWLPLHKELECKEDSETWLSISVDIFIFLVLGFLATVWLRESLVAVAEARQSGIFRVWNDFLLQAVEIGYQINYPSFKGESPYLAGLPITFYHRASYGVAALYGWLTGDSLVATATYFWLPAGFVLMGLGAYSLGAILGGRIVGILSVLALFLLPDASMYGLKNGYFAFYWLLAVAPGSGYALSLSFASLACFIAGYRQSNGARLIFFGFAIALLTVFFRVHIAIPMLALYLALVFFSMKMQVRVRLILFFGLLIIFIGLLLIFENITFAPHFLSGQKDGLKYIEAVHLATPTAYEGIFDRMTLGSSHLVRSWVGYPLMLLAQHGVLLIVPVLGLFALRRDKRNWPLFAIPFGIILIHCLITFSFPTPSHGDITEWSHRSFVLVHSILVVFLVVCLANISIFKRLIHWSHLSPLFMAILIVFMGALFFWVPLKYGEDLQYGSLRDGPSACATKITPEIFVATEFIRGKSNKGDIIFASDGDPSALLTSLTGLQSYMSRSSLFQKVGGESKVMAEARMHEIDRLMKSTEFDSFLEFGKYSHVRWLVVYIDAGQTIPSNVMSHAVFRNTQLAIFDLSKK